jgi:hypothetical protein
MQAICANCISNGAVEMRAALPLSAIGASDGRGSAANSRGNLIVRRGALHNGRINTVGLKPNK